MNIAALKTNFSAAEVVVDRQEAFKQDIRVAAKQAIANLGRDVIGVGKDCLWVMALGKISRSIHSPVGTNARYYARQAFEEVVSESQFSKFVY